jgi:hypothetical protein
MERREEVAWFLSSASHLPSSLKGLPLAKTARKRELIRPAPEADCRRKGLALTAAGLVVQGP